MFLIFESKFYIFLFFLMSYVQSDNVAELNAAELEWLSQFVDDSPESPETVGSSVS